MSENERNDDMEIDLVALFKSIFSNLWITVLAFIIAVAAAVVYLMNAVPTYEATASIMVEPFNDINLSSIFDAGFSTSRNISTELEILNSRTTYRNAIEKLDLSQYETSDGTPYSELENPLTYESLQNMVTVSPVSDTPYLNITVTSSNPEFARDFCNAFIESYSDVLTGIARTSASNQLEFISAEIPKMEERLVEASTKLSNFQSENSMLQLSEENRMLLLQMSYLTMARDPLLMEVEETRRYISDFESLYEGLSDIRARWEQDQVVANDLDSIISWYNETIYYDFLGSTSNNQSSPLSASQQARYYTLTQMMSSTETNLENYLSGMLSGILQGEGALEYAGYFVQMTLGQRRLDVIDSLLANINVELDKVPSLERMQMELESEVEGYQQLVLSLREAESQTALFESSITENVTLIDEAVLPEIPVSPQKAKVLLIAGFLGIFIGLGISVLYFLMDKRIKNKEDLKKALSSSVPILGWIPLKNAEDKGERGIDLSLDPMSFISERYKHIASAMIYGKRLESKAITICSPGKNDGKTTTLANIAYALALNGKKVLVVDMDLRMPNLENVFEVRHSDVGIVDVLSGEVRAEDAIRIPYDEVPNLHIIGTGKNMIVPSIVIQAKALSEFISGVEGYYDYIFFDAPPLLYASELLTIASVARGVLIVARAGISTSDEVRALCDGLRDSSANIIGAALNGLALDDSSSSDKHSYGYGYGYGYMPKKDGEQIKKQYVKKKGRYGRIYKAQMKARLRRKENSSWPEAKKAYFPSRKEEKEDVKARENSTLKRNIDDYLSAIEADDDAKGRKQVD